ncbi:hypothetical protein, partial [Bordetella pertussis]
RPQSGTGQHGADKDAAQAARQAKRNRHIIKGFPALVRSFLPQEPGERGINEGIAAWQDLRNRIRSSTNKQYP